MFEILKTAFRSLFANKTRSVLTMLGIIIGVGAVITMVAIGSGAASMMDNFISGMGSNLVLLFPGTARTGGSRQAAGSAATLTLADADILRREGLLVAEVVPEVYGGSQLVYGNRNWNTTALGATPGVLEARTWNVAVGQSFSDADVSMASKVCLLGDTVAKNLFAFEDEDPINKIVRIRRVPFRVVGVLEAKGPTPWGSDQDDFVIVPITTAQRRLFRSGILGSVRRITVQAVDRRSVPAMQEEIRGILRQHHRLPEGVPDDFVLRDMTQILENAAASTRVMGLLLGAVASISLLVGGIGIMNIMLVSVSERTREIGIRMAVGARPIDVRIQFLAEAVSLSILGGAVGILGGVGASRAITEVFEWPTIVSTDSILLAVGFSAVVGVFFGFWPAWKASNLDPIDALRYE
ncbi:MAG: ABC transporter permease [Synergistaceae bacterium]|jgi:putative ABC transport system permease protein|nr:ABC transporter permease [Synergistaceae bacterium]